MKSNRFKSFVSILVAIVTILGALTAGLAAKASSNAGDQDFAGMGAAISSQKADLINEVNAYEHYRAYTTYVRYFELGFLLTDPKADEKTKQLLYNQQQEVWGIADGILSTFFQGRYLNPDGTYALDRELQEARAEDEQSNDLNFAPYFDKADSLRARSSFLIANLIVFTVSFWFLTLAQVMENSFKYFMALFGILLGLAGILGIFIGGFLL